MIKLSYGKTLNDISWYSISDDTCSLSDVVINVDDSSVNYQMLGIYSCSIIAVDLYGNESTESFEVKIVDEVKPQVLARLTQLGVPMTEICKSIDAYVLSDIVIDYALRNNL